MEILSPTYTSTNVSMREDCVPLMKLLIEFQNVTLLHTEGILLQCRRHKMALHIFFAFIMTHPFLFD